MTTPENYQPAPFSVEHMLDMSVHHESINILDGAAVICDFNSVPSGGGFTLIERAEDGGVVQHDFYRRIKSSDPALEPSSAPEWYLVAGEGESRTLWPVILHGAMSPNGYTASGDVRRGMRFCYQEVVSFLSEGDAPSADKLQRPPEFEKRIFLRPADLGEDERLRLAEAGHIYMSESGDWRWRMPGVNFYTGPIDQVDYMPSIFTADDVA